MHLIATSYSTIILIMPEPSNYARIMAWPAGPKGQLLHEHLLLGGTLVHGGVMV